MTTTEVRPTILPTSAEQHLARQKVLALVPEEIHDAVAEALDEAMGIAFDGGAMFQAQKMKPKIPFDRRGYPELPRGDGEP